ncbi:MAG: hypothetical protein U1G08_05765 [Verrucomicrobiota bacterium]
MRTIQFLILTSLILGIAQGAAFQNLDFEAAQIVGAPGQPLVLSHEALPGWAVSWNPLGSEGDPDYGENAKYVLYNIGYLSGPSAIIAGPENPNHPDIGPWRQPPIAGNFSAGGAVFQLSQRGDIPSNLTTLVFDSTWTPAIPTSVYDFLRVSVNNTPLTLVPTGSSGRYRCDVTPWAGQEVVLKFSTGENPILVDNISLVPEPTAWGVAIGMPLVALAFYQRRTRHSSR